MNMYQDFDFPNELRCQLKPFIGFVGLSPGTNALHTHIWETFYAARNVDQVPMEITLISMDFTLPPIKPKKNSYEWYIPKGILKTNWMTKHTRQIPSVVVLFYELDWDDSQWSEKKLELANHIHILKSSIEGRPIKIAVVLIQHSINFISMASDGNVASERANEICSTCNLNSKLLFVLHNNEHLQGCIIRLEAAFIDLAFNYYTQEIRVIKEHKEYLNKNNHQMLFVRHQFKMGFFSQIKRDTENAQIYYSQAYVNLQEIKSTDLNRNEIRIVAGFINYKLCEIYFLSNAGLAFNQFNLHIDKYRSKAELGPPELLFEHYNWLSKQYLVFGQLFENALKGLPTNRPRHPGFYYEQAAVYASLRKQLRTIPMEKPVISSENDPLIGHEKVEYYGQRIWRVSNRTEVNDLARERLAISILQYRESYIVDHSKIIISYLGSAINQYKIHRSSRKRRVLAIQMADEYYTCDEYREALTLYSHMLWEYRKDRWWSLTIDLLRKTLNCAFLTASIQEYVEYCVEAMYLFPPEEKLRMKNNLFSITNKIIPQPEPDLSDIDINGVNDLWAFNFSTSSKYFQVELFTGTTFILCKANFCSADSDCVNLQIWLRNEYVEAISFSRLSVGIGSQTTNTEYHILKCRNVNSNDEPNLHFESGEVKCIPFSYVPPANDIDGELQLKYVSLILGIEQEDASVIDLRFSGTCTETDLIERQSVYSNVGNKLYSSFINLKPKLAVEVKPRKSKFDIEIDHASPSLIGELYKVDVSMKNNEPLPVENVFLQLNFSLNTSSSSSSTTNVSTYGAVNDTSPTSNVPTEVYESIDGKPFQLPYSFNLGNFKIEQQLEKTLYFKTCGVVSKSVIFKVIYSILNNQEEEMNCSNEKSIKIDCESPFNVTASFLSCKCECISTIYSGQPMFMRMQIDCLSPWPLFVEKTCFKMENYVRRLSNSSKEKSCLSGCKLHKENVGAEIIACSVENVQESCDLSLGNFFIYWRRDNYGENELPLVCTEVQLPKINVSVLPLKLDTKLTIPAYLRSTVLFTLILYNQSDELMSFDLMVESNDADAFMYSGCKQISFNIIPDGKYQFHCNLLPLHVGYVPLPRFNLVIRSDVKLQSEINNLLNRSIPTTLFVMPQKKELSNDNE